MTAVTIERCVLRLVAERPWREEHGDLVASLIQCWLPVVVEQLEDLLGDDDGVIEEPVVARMKLCARDLRFAEIGLPLELAGPDALNQRARDALCEALTPQLQQRQATNRPGATGPTAAAEGHRDRDEPPALCPFDVAVVRALLGMREAGGLAPALQHLPSGLCTRWHRSVLGAFVTESAPATDPLPAVERAAEAVRTMLDRMRHRSASLRALAPEARELLIAVEALASGGLRPGSAELGRLVQRMLREASEAGLFDESTEKVHAAKTSAQEQQGGPVAAPLHAAARHGETTTEIDGDRSLVPATARANAGDGSSPGAALARDAVERSAGLSEGDRFPIHSALPFLALIPLARLGMVDVLHASLADRDATPAAFALAFAHKLLEPPERGWRYRPEARRTAAAFAGFREPPPLAIVSDFARHAGPALDLVERLVVGALCEGHRPGAPLLVARARAAAGERLLLLEREGLFPLQWLDAGRWPPPAGEPLADLAARELVALPADVVQADTLSRLDQAGVRFVTDAEPLRGESWRRLSRGRRVCWTNAERPDRMVLAAFSGTDRCLEIVSALFDDLAQRRATPRARDGRLEDVLSWLAGVGLGAVAWSLWREQEPTDPMLTIERMATLDGVLRVEAERVVLRLSLGRRFQDLYQAGLTRDLTGLPWLGRPLVITGG